MLRGRHDGGQVADVATFAGQPHRAGRALDDLREDLGQLGLGQGLFLEQLEHQVVQHVAIVVQRMPGLVVSGLDQATDLLVDNAGNRLRVVALMAHVATEEDLAAGVLAELDGTDPLTHAELRHHPPGQAGGLLDVVAGSGRRVMEDHLLRDPTAKGEGQLVEHLVASGGVLVVQRHHHGVAQGPATRQDGDLGDRVGVEHRRGYERMPTLVIRGDLLLAGTHDPGALLRTGDHPVDGFVQGQVVDQLAVAARGEQRGLVEDVGQVGTGETGGTTGHREQVDTGGQRLALAVHLQDAVPADHVGCIDCDLTVEAPRTQQRGVEDVGTVGCRDQDDVGLDVEAVHLHQQLVEGLLALVVTTAEAGATVAPDGINLVDEHDRGGVGLGLLEQVSHS